MQFSGLTCPLCQNLYIDKSLPDRAFDLLYADFNALGSNSQLTIPIELPVQQVKDVNNTMEPTAIHASPHQRKPPEQRHASQYDMVIVVIVMMMMTNKLSRQRGGA